MKGKYLRVTRIDKGKNAVTDKGYIFNEIVEENVSSLKMEMPIKVQEAHRTLKNYDKFLQRYQAEISKLRRFIQP